MLSIPLACGFRLFRTIDNRYSGICCLDRQDLARVADAAGSLARRTGCFHLIEDVLQQFHDRQDASSEEQTKITTQCS